MGRPEPCVLFVQNFVHPQLDEYVDEVLFAEPVVITACEILEQNASSASPLITLLGATSPPSFALEVFVHCEGETRFRRLCQPFLYSHSSSNVLEVEAVVTSHLVIRGSYRSLSLVIYGNTAEDLGQFNIEFDLDNSLANVVCSPEGKLEDLPPALQSNKLKFEESISALNSLSLPVAKLDLSAEIKQFVHLILKIIEVSDLGDAINKVVSTIVSAVSYFITNDLHVTTFPWDKCKQSGCVYGKGEFSDLLTDARDELLQIYRMLEDKSGNESDELVGGGVFLESEADLPTSQLLLDALSQFFNFKGESSSNDFPVVSQNKNLIGGLSLIILLCSAREGCFHFVNGGGMEHLARAFCHLMEGSTAITLLLLGVVEQATRHAVGCEGFLGWWPREEENVPAGSSEGYTLLLKLLLQKQRHDVASLATYILHRLRSYEVAARYESAVLSLLGDLSTGGKITGVSLNMLNNVKLELRKLLKLINSRGLIEDPSLVACVRRSVILCQTEGLLSYKATINLIASSSCCFHNWDIDPHLLSLLSERGFLPLSAALLSSRILRSEVGYTMDIFVDIASSIGAILLSLLFCRSGLIFLLLHPEVTSSVILALESAEDIDKEECVPLRYTFVLLSKGFFCRPQEVGIIMEMHLRVVNAIDRLLISTPHSEEFLWVLWEICSLSRSDCGRQALLALGQFPEAVSVLIEALRCGKDLESPFLTNGASPLNLAIFHSAAEIFEVLVTDSTSSSLGSWIEHAMELHKALHSSSPGSNRKDAPTRLLEWIDAGVVYHRNGAIGLLRYAAILTSGGDAHLTSTSILVSDSLDVENVVGDSSSGSDGQVIENLLGKLVFDKSFDGITLRDSSIAQLTTAFRILAFISENSAVAAALYDEGAITLIYIVLVNCKFMLERSSNIYDYLVDEGAECNSTSDLLLERSREQSLVDLLIPSLLLLIALLHKLQETKEQHRNKKLLNALLQLHREVSPKLAACAADLSSPYPGSALGLGSVCRLLVSALAFWPVYGWSPGLFHCLLNIVEDTSKKNSVEDISLLSLGPKEACSLLCLLSDLFPEEGIWLWENGMPSLSALRAVAVGSLLGPQKEGQVDWYLQRGHTEMLLTRLTPLLDKISQIILQFSFTALLVIQDMLRVLIIRISCQNTDNAIVLLRPMLSWAQDHISEPSLSDMDVFKVYRLLDFLASLLEHPRAKVLLFEVGAVSMLTKALERCVDTSHTDGKLSSGIHIPAKNGFSLLSWCLPVLKSFSLMCDSRASLYHYKVHNKYGSQSLSTEDCSLILIQLLKLFQVLPVGRELLACLATFKELGTLSEGKSAFASISAQIRSSGHEDLEYHKGYERDGSDNILDEYDWVRCPPLLYCWRNILRSIDEKDGSLTHAIEALSALSIGALRFCVEGKSFNMDVVAVLRCLFGLPRDSEIAENFPEENIKDVQDMIALLDRMVHEDDYSSTSDMKNALHQAMDYAKSMVFLLQQPIDSMKVDDVILSTGFPLSSTKALVCSKMCPPHLLVPSLTKLSVTNDFALSISHGRNIDTSVENPDNCISLGGLADKFLWECPEVLPDRLTMPVLPGKRKLTSVEGLNRRARGETPGPETMGSNTFSRGLGPLTAPSGPTRRDTFRQRKPNTSRPPSMHVDDYVARERNVDGINSNSNVNLVQRGGTSGGRPPSIHVDEFMARQRERQNPVAMAVGDVTRLTKSAPPEDGVDSENRSKKLKADLDDDLHELNIVFDGEESESDDRLPFPQPDDILQPASVIIEEHSPHSIVGETDSEVNKSSQFSHLGARSASHVDENTQSELSSRMSMARPEITLTREASVSSDSKYFETNQEKASLQEHSDDTNNAVTASGGFESAAQANLSSFSIPFYYKGPASSVQVLGDSRVPPPFYQDSPQQATTVPLVNGSQGFHDQKFLSSQPPLPPLPPPMTVSSVVSQSVDPVQFYSTPYGQTIRDLQSVPPMGYQLQSFDASGPNMVTSFHLRDERPPHGSAAGALPSVSSSAFGESINQPFNSQLQTEYLAAFNGSPTPLTSSHPMLDTKYSWDSVSSAGRSQDEINSSGASARPLPPLPPMPPPFAAASFNQAPAKSSTSKSSVYNQSNVGTSQPLSDARLGTLPASGGSLTSYSPPSVVPPLLLTRPLSIPGTLISNTIAQQQGQNPPSLLHTIPTQPAIQSLQPRAQLQALQPPQPPRPPPQHLRPPQVSQQSEQGASLLHSPIHVQVQPLQMQQQPHVSPIHVYYQSQQHEHHLSHLQQQQVEHSQPQNLPQQGDNAQQKQQDSGMSLQQYFSSPEAIQALLSDREKLCQLLEQHPKLMQMLQEKLGQL